MMKTLLGFHFAAVAVLVSPAVGSSRSVASAFVIAPALWPHHKPGAHVSRRRNRGGGCPADDYNITALTVRQASRMDEDEYDDDLKQNNWREEKEKLFNHDDWSNLRRNRRHNEFQDVMLPMLAIVVLYLFWVAVVI